MRFSRQKRKNADFLSKSTFDRGADSLTEPNDKYIIIKACEIIVSVKYLALLDMKSKPSLHPTKSDFITK